MPSLFSKRSRSVSTSRPTTPASNSAHLAAAQAFLASQPSSSNLSASAAATALRTMSPTPTPVENVQTKRMLNRQASNSSVASAPRGRSRGVVQRRTSAGSMTERTFRSPSPGQHSSQNGGAPVVSREAPPVPPLPQNISTEDVPPIPAKSHRRSASMDFAPPRVRSPTAARPAGRAQNVQQTSSSSSSTNLAAAAARKSTAPPQSMELQRSDSQDSRNSYNFSYPRGSRPNSPPPRSPIVGSKESLPLSSSQGISAAETARIQNELTQTAAKPVKKKKKKVDQSAAEGSHLQTGTMGAKPTVTPLEPLPSDYQPPTAVQVVKKPRKKAALTGPSSHFPDSQDGIASDSDNASDSPRDRRSQRAAGLLNKQPSVVREDWEGEQEEQEPSPVQAPLENSVRAPLNNSGTSIQQKKIIPEANMSRKIEDPSGPSKGISAIHDTVTLSSSEPDQASKPLLPAVKTAAQAGRGASISPSRSTRFSDRLASDLASGRKHEPLGRSVSPAKSALKHSSTVGSDASPTDAKFPGRRGSSVTPSEASDVSTEGNSGRKKAGRVSFEGFADAKDSLADVRAQKETTKRSWLGGKGRSSNLGAISADEEVEEGMKPRPALPSFGSVRRAERSPNRPTDTRDDGLHAVNKTASSSETSSIADPPTMNTSISSDHALGGMLYRESLSKPTSNTVRSGSEPVPPEVTSVEGTGYHSDSESVYSDDERNLRATQAASQRLGKSIEHTEDATDRSGEIPAISVLPATPGLDETGPGKDWGLEVPGGFPVSGSSSYTSVQDETDKNITSSTPKKEPSGLGLAQNVQDYTSLVTEEASADSSPSQLMTITEEDSDDSSLYSDAAEDLSDLEGDGFGSINAIVESPVVASRPQQKIISPPESPLATVNPQRPVQADRTASWDDTQAHWSGLAQRSRDNKQQAQESSEEAKSTPQVTTVAPVKAKKPKTKPIPMAAAPAPAPAPAARSPKSSATDLSSKVQVPTTTTKDSSRASSKPAAAATAISTKRMSGTQTQGHLKSSMRGEPEPVNPTLRQKPVSQIRTAAPATAAPRAALQKKHIPPAPAPKAPPRRFSNDSDSDSSFKKARRTKKPMDGKYTMKRSMRGAPTESEKPTAPAGRGGVRSLSPPVDRRPTSPLGMKSMRTTMRGSNDLGTPTLRGQPESKRSSSLFSRNRTAKSPTRPLSSAMPLTSKLKSRIFDSDDEDGPRPTHYKSRFADSSDEDEPATFRPVRGIPRKKDDEDSTDLDDSSDDQAQTRKAKPAAAKNLTIIPPPADQEVASPPLSPNTAKKRGLWSRLRGKKKEEEIAPNKPNTITQREASKKETSDAEDDATNAKELGFGSTAERDAAIEQARLKLEAAKKRPQSPPGRPGSPFGKLQRRMTPQRILSDSWAPPKMPAAQADRPQTSDGVEEAARPEMGSRQPTSEKVSGDGAVYGKSGKKKKFGFLRKAFGLTD